ncbi:YggS family pyridoxal phosphate enzyme [Thermoleophilia bacterium SCSIO 60948]|nr:YggS family pyridoxal phosphate enzyme [Thermoleophilia bacterium SCSIO 60948]
MPELIRDIDPGLVRDRLGEVREAGRPGLEILVATKYVPVEEMGALAEAGVGLVGENRLDSLIEKQERFADRFTWDFIGNLQSRKAPEVAERVRLIHSLASESAARKLERAAGSGAAALIEVNVAGEGTKGGVAPSELAALIEACPLPVEGLMTMPPATADPELSRPHFARLAELAAEHGLERLSMGTSQDWRVAVEEGATIVRLGSGLLRREPLE